METVFSSKLEKGSEVADIPATEGRHKLPGLRVPSLAIHSSLQKDAPPVYLFFFDGKKCFLEQTVEGIVGNSRDSGRNHW
mmetsp:Transcript_20466/g.42786  ORF Transcript_20466/g.42786 Transcript_20466/m.42786 type:complete len:80 (-) Transcript_20466:225-464(-)